MAYPVFQVAWTKNNWSTVSPPRNWKPGILLDMIFTDPNPSHEIKKGGFEWCNTKDDQTATNINNYVAGGVNGQTPGIYEPPALQIFIPGINGNPNIYLFQGVLDLPNGVFECDRVVCPITYVGAIDWFYKYADSIKYYSLTLQGLQNASITNVSTWAAYSGCNCIIGPPVTPGQSPKYKYKVVPYTCTYTNALPESINLLLNEINMFGNIKTAITNTVNDIKNIIADATVSVTVLWSVPGVIDLIGAVLGFVAQLIWDVVLVIALIGSVETLINQCGLLIKYKYAMTASDIINAGIDYINNFLGTQSPNPITFSSTIFGINIAPGYGGAYVNTTIMPKKDFKENLTHVPPNLLSSVWSSISGGGQATEGTEVQGGNLPNYNFGPMNLYCYGYPDNTFKDFFTDIGKVFNAKLFMIGGQLRFEEQHYFISGTYQIPNVDKPGNDTLNMPAPYAYNTGELPWQYLLAFKTDDDERTKIVYTGTTCGVSTTPPVSWNVQNQLPCSGVELILPFALAKRKEYLNFIENVINDILNLVAPIVNSVLQVISAIDSVINDINSVFGGGNILQLPTLTKPGIVLGLQVCGPLNLMTTNLLQTELIGTLETSKDTWGTPKIFIGVPSGSQWKIDQYNGQNGVGTSTPNQPGVWNNPNVPVNTPGRGEGNMSAFALMNLFHCLNLALYTPVNAKAVKQPQVNNQWVLYRGKQWAMCASDYSSLLGINMCLSPLGKKAKIEKGSYDVYSDLYKDVNYRVSQIYSLNFSTVTTVDGN